MKWIIAIVFAVFLFNSSVVSESVSVASCYSDSFGACTVRDVPNDELASCNSQFSGFLDHQNMLQGYANVQLTQSYNYLLLASSFGSYVKNRPGFYKQFQTLSDKSWENTIDLIKYITKRGGSHDFSSRAVDIQSSNLTNILELAELPALAYALESEKVLSNEAHKIHRSYMHSHNHKSYDPEVAHYIEEEFLEDQASTIRKFSGYTNDLKNLIKYKNTEKDKDFSPSLNVHLFDEYLKTQ